MSDDYIAEMERQISAFFLAAERSQARRVLPDVGRLEKTAFHLLGELVQQGPSRPSAVAHLIRLDLSTVSRHVAALENVGLVAREPDPADRRACLVRATERGEEVLARLRAARRQRMRQVLAGWPNEDRRELARLLGRLNGDIRRVEDETAAATEPSPSPRAPSTPPAPPAGQTLVSADPTRR